ncbi:MAG: hypothetical protein HY259_15535 [Chloroflexi bacterium]|nr:hypothetical protein [Chloroflexota bacterium]
MGNEQKTRAEQQERKKRARLALLAFLKTLRQSCKTFKSADEWYVRMKDLRGLLAEYQTEIPAAARQEMQDATNLTDPTRAGISKACEVLQKNIEKAIALLPAGGGLLAPALIIAFIVAAVVVGLTVFVAEATAVQIAITNNGCPIIQAPTDLPIYIPGLKLPKQIPSGRTEVATAPRIPAELEVKSDGTVTLIALTVPITLPVRNRLRSVTYDGVSVLDRRIPLNLGERPRHELIVTCG